MLKPIANTDSNTKSKTQIKNGSNTYNNNYRDILIAYRLILIGIVNVVLLLIVKDLC